MIVNKSPNFIKFLYFLIFIIVWCLVITFIYACILGSKLSTQETVNLVLHTNLQRVILNNQELRNIIDSIVNVKPYSKY
jgi:hypothetical protein